MNLSKTKAVPAPIDPGARIDVTPSGVILAVPVGAGTVIQTFLAPETVREICARWAELERAETQILKAVNDGHIRK